MLESEVGVEHPLPGLAGDTRLSPSLTGRGPRLVLSQAGLLPRRPGLSQHPRPPLAGTTAPETAPPPRPPHQPGPSCPLLPGLQALSSHPCRSAEQPPLLDSTLAPEDTVLLPGAQGLPDPHHTAHSHLPSGAPAVAEREGASVHVCVHGHVLPRPQHLGPSLACGVPCEYWPGDQPPSPAAISVLL